MDTPNKERTVGPEAVDPRLPSALAGRYLVCKCFGVGTPEMGNVLRRLREQSPRPDEQFPKNITTELLKRAIRGQGEWRIAVGAITSEALYDRLLREHRPGSVSMAAHFADKLSNSLLSLYQAILPKLRVDRILVQRVLWVLAEEVFAPLVFLELKLRRGRGIGTEYDTDSCWYFPRRDGTEIVKPFPRVLKNWMHVAGYRVAYDFGKVSDSVRKKVEGWMKGDHVPEPFEIRRFVGEYAKQFRDFGEPEEWIGRLGLAAGMQNLYCAWDQYFSPLIPNASLRLVEFISDPKMGEVAVDIDQYLTELRSFFAARLVQRRWKADGTWRKRVQPDPPNPPAPAPTASDEEWTKFKYEMERGNSYGCRFVEAILEESFPSRGIPAEPLATYIQFEEYLFEKGIEELNCILDSQRCSG